MFFCLQKGTVWLYMSLLFFIVIFTNILQLGPIPIYTSMRNHVDHPVIKNLPHEPHRVTTSSTTSSTSQLPGQGPAWYLSCAHGLLPYTTDISQQVQEADLQIFLLWSLIPDPRYWISSGGPHPTWQHDSSFSLQINHLYNIFLVVMGWHPT